MLENTDLGKLILRLCLGALILFHGIAKLMHGIDGIEGMISGHGLPGFLAYGVYVGEVIAPLMILVGYQTRIGAIFIVINMLVAFILVHMGQLLSLGSSGGWALELQGMYLFGALALVFLGPGRYKLHS